MIRRILYWAAVMIVSLAVVVALVYVLESRDGSSVEPATAAQTG